MAAINMYLGRYLDLATDVNRSSATWRIDFSIALRPVSTDQNVIVLNQNGGDFLQAQIGVRSLSDFLGRDVSRVRLNNTTAADIYEYEDRVLNDGEFHTISYRCDGVNFSFYRDGVQVGSSVAFAQVLNAIGMIGWAASAPGEAINDYDLQWVKLYDSTDESALIHHWSADDSNTGNTGAQPVLVDIVGGNNATGVGFPTDGSAWVLPPALTFLSAPAVVGGSITSSGAQIQLTTSLAASVKVLDTVAGSTQPDSTEFDAVSAIGTTTGAAVFTFSVTGQAASTTRRKWLQVSDGTTTLYASVDVTTIAASTTITAINGGAPIRYGQATIDVTWDTAPETPGALTINGVAQSNHVAVDGTTTRFGPLVWPNVMYGQTAILSANGSSITTPQITTAVGYDYVTLSGYIENPPETPDVATALGDASAVAVNGDQFVWHTESGEVTIASNGTLSFGTGFDGTVTIAIVDSADGAHSDFVTLYYGASLDLIPTIPAFSSLINQEPGVEVIDSFVVADVTAGEDITFAATGSMTVSTSNSGPWSSSVVRQLGQTVYRRMVTGTFGQSVTGGVSSGGQSQSCTYTTRAAVAPTITEQPSNDTVEAGSPGSFSVTMTDAASYQWYLVGTGAVSGATSNTFAPTTASGDAGTTRQYYVIGTSSEGGTVQSDTVTLTITNATASFTSAEPLRNNETKALLANTLVNYKLITAGGTEVTGSATTDASGYLSDSSVDFGTAGDTVIVYGEFGTYITGFKAVLS